jgi:hypothetical protein
MDAFTMLIMACVSGEPTCTASRISDMGFTTLESCESRIDDITKSMTRQFATRAELKGKQVTYDVSCLDKTQLWQKLGIAQSDT